MTPREDHVFSVAEARAFVRDLFVPNPIIYWADLLISLSVAYGCAAVYFVSPNFSAQQVLALFVSGFALHRVANYIHEIAHLNSKRSLGLAELPMDSPYRQVAYPSVWSVLKVLFRNSHSAAAPLKDQGALAVPTSKIA